MRLREASSPRPSLQAADSTYIWHPFTQAQGQLPPPVFVRGEGARLFDDAGGSVLDCISSWWVNLHGHGHRAIADAIAAQARKLEHVLFAGATHPPAIEYAKMLIETLQAPLQRVFYSDNGSTAVECALKMSLQFWQNGGSSRRRLLAFEGGYHGDTFGAMSAGRGSPFFTRFSPWMFPVDLLHYAEAVGDEDPEAAERRSLFELDRYLAHYGNELAACILEPLIQGAGGMRMARPDFVRAVAEKVRATGALVIFDEVFTGFGRTGKMFAHEHLNFVPDILCLAKGITGGFLPLAATVTTEAVYNGFLDARPDRAFLHGHSYTANPIGCAAAIASLELFTSENTLQKIAALAAVHERELPLLAMHPRVKHPRRAGSVAAFDLDIKPADMQAFIARMYATDVFLRPLGQTVYFVPPYCIGADTLRRVYALISRVLDESFGDAKNARPKNGVKNAVPQTRPPLKRAVMPG